MPARSAAFTMVAKPVPDELSEICTIAWMPCDTTPSAASGSSVGRSAPADTSSTPTLRSSTASSSRLKTLLVSPGANTVPTRRAVGSASLTIRAISATSELVCAPVTFGR